jgi:hypothetical protein
MAIRITFFLFSLSLLFFSCREDVDQFIPQHESSARMVEASLLGRVWTAGGATVEGAEVLLNGQPALSDGEGFFNLLSVQAPEFGAVAEVRKEGFFPGRYRLYWTGQAQIQSDFFLIPQTLAGSLAVESGGEVLANDGMRIIFPAQALEHLNGEPASGMARIFAYWLDPSDEAFPDRIPGGTQGEDELGKRQHLQSFGILAIDMTDENGAPLRLAAGKMMELDFPVPASLLSAAPANLLLWSLDAGRGVWQESSLAYLANSSYIAQATGGQFWNVAVHRPLVQVRSWVKEAGGSPAREVLLRAFAPGGRLLASGRTQSQGLVALDLPSGMEISLHLYDLCGAERHSQLIPALSGNVSLTPISLPGNGVAVVQGRLLDCDENPVEKGYAQIVSGGREVLALLEEGVFSVVLPACSGTSGTVIVHDLVRQFQTPPLAFSPTGTTDFGDLTLCNDSPEYLSFNLDGAVQFSDAPEISVSGNTTTISDAELGVFMAFEGITTGSFPVLFQDFVLAGLSSPGLSALDLVVDISRFDPSGGFVIGSFNGKAVELDGTERAISGVVKVKRW